MARQGWWLVLLLGGMGCEAEGDGPGTAGGAGGAVADGTGGTGGAGPADMHADDADQSGGEPDMQGSGADLGEEPDMPGDTPDSGDSDMAGDTPDLGEPDLGGDDPDMAGADPDMAAGDPDMLAGACPPAGPYGDAVGDVAPDLALPDCDGTLHSVHGECGQPLWIFEFAAWCPPCRRFASGMDALYTELGRDRLTAWVIISATADGGPVNAAFCRQIRDQYGLTMPVLYDADGELQRVYGVPPNEVNVLIDGAGTLVYKNQYGGERGIRAAVEALGE